MQAVLISTYEMGRQPFGLASPAAWLRRAGWNVRCVDLARTRFRDDTVVEADLIGFYLPMHTATRLAGPVIEKARRLNPSARLCAYGLYAPVNAEWLRSVGVDAIFGGEFEADLTAYASTAAGPRRRLAIHDVEASSGLPTLPRLRFLVPDRSDLPPLDRYAKLITGDGAEAVAGYTEASRGCLHLCRHCPVVPVYRGRFRIVQPGVVLADVAAQIAAGAQHMTFGDPDFLNGPAHAQRIVEGLHAAHPHVTYDVTIKIEHLLRHRRLLPVLRGTGCLFITSAVESLDDRVLAKLEKGHTRADFLEAVGLCRTERLTLVPTFVAFHPWITLEAYADLLDTIEDLDLVEHVAPIQLAIRLLIPHGSRLLELEDIRRVVGPFDHATLTYRWTHPDSRVDRLQRAVAELVGVRSARTRGELFDDIRRLTASYLRDAATVRDRWRTGDSKPARDRATVPYLNEPWYC